MGTAKKQHQIQQALNALGWSHKVFAEIVYEELYGDEYGGSLETDTEVIRKLAANIKKQLQRPSTPEELLDRYLNTLSEHPDYQSLNLGKIIPQYVAHTCLHDEIINELKAISCALDE
ncbi:elongation factor Ts [Photobacterium nomapromontoriensis]|uniref:elongation factor Ts n=1 Tax=Photobacterium nomapromontoriensis TaxID=2910237 RepID=UPI003D0F483E